MPRKQKQVFIRDKILVACKFGPTGPVKLYEFNTEPDADAFIAEARSRNLETIKGKYENTEKPKKKEITWS